MRVFVNAQGESIVQTPFGGIEQSILEQILPKIGIKWNGDDWTFISQNIGRKDEKTNKEIWIPIRAYNFEIALHKAKRETLSDEQWRILNLNGNGDKELRTNRATLAIQKALSYNFEDKYLPEVESEKSYSALFRKYGLD